MSVGRLLFLVSTLLVAAVAVVIVVLHAPAIGLGLPVLCGYLVVLLAGVMHLRQKQAEG